MCTSFFADAFYCRCRNLRWSMSRTTKLATNLKHQRAAMQSYPHGQATCFRRSLGNYNSLEEQQSLEKYHVSKCRIALFSRKSYHVNLECDFGTLRSGESDSFHIYIYIFIKTYIYICGNATLPKSIIYNKVVLKLTYTVYQYFLLKRKYIYLYIYILYIYTRRGACSRKSFHENLECGFGTLCEGQEQSVRYRLLRAIFLDKEKAGFLGQLSVFRLTGVQESQILFSCFLS
jgi:hypothetical protein